MEGAGHTFIALAPGFRLRSDSEMPRPPLARIPLMEAAVRLFVEGGIDRTGIRDIAHAAGVTEAAVYRHWSGKEALVQAIYQHHLHLLMTVLEGALATASVDPRARLLAAASAAYAHYDENPMGFRFVVLSAADLRHALGVSLERTPLDVVGELVRELAPPDADLEFLAAACTGIFLQTAQYVAYGRLPGPLVRHAPAVAQAAWRLLERSV
jgi:AcrR family transcriptional regulator